MENGTENGTLATSVWCEFPGFRPPLTDAISYGIIYPILTVLILFTNINGIIVVSRLHNFNQTNMFLMAIFIADLFTTITPFPKFFQQYSLNWNKLILLPHYPWCFISSLLFPVIPVITNNISIWFVVMLAVQRFLCVWKRALYNRFFSRSRVIVTIVIISIATICFHSVLLVDSYREPMTCTNSDDGSHFSICNPNVFLIPAELENYILSTYYLSRIAFFHVVPVLAIGISNLLLVRLIRRAEVIRRRIFSRDRRMGVDESSAYHDSVGHENSRNIFMSTRKKSVETITTITGDDKAKRMSSTTRMLIVISTIYFFQHICQSLLFISGVILNITGQRESPFLMNCIVVQNLIYWAGFSANFFLCLSLQTPFRQAFLLMYQNIPLVRWVLSSCIRKPIHNDSIATFRRSVPVEAENEVELTTIRQSQNW